MPNKPPSRKRFKKTRRLRLLRPEALLLRLTYLCEHILLREAIYWIMVGVLIIVSLITPGASLLGKARFLPPLWLSALVALVSIPMVLAAVYLLCPLPPTPGWQYSRQPLSTLRYAEVVLVDSALLLRGRKITAITLPFTPRTELRMRPESLLLATAMAYTAGYAAEEDQPPLLEAVAALGLNRELLLRYHPASDAPAVGSLAGCVVCQKERRMTYYAGAVNELLPLCIGLHDGKPRTMTGEDRARLHQTVFHLGEQGARTIGYAVMDEGAEIIGPVFLGMAALSDELIPEAVAACEALQKEGICLQTQPIDPLALPPVHLASLRTRLKLHTSPYAPHVIVSSEPVNEAAIRLFPADARHFNFDRPLILAREWFARLEERLHLTLLCLLPLMLACILGPVEPLCISAACLMLLAGTARTDRLHMGRLQTLLPCLLAAAVRIVLQIAVPTMAGDLMALFVLAAALVRSLTLAAGWKLMLTALGLGLFALVLALVTALLSSGASLLGCAFPLLGGVLAAYLMWWPALR